MTQREPESTADDTSKEASRETASMNPPVAYIPACGTLCDAFWWARRSNRAKSAE